MFTYTHRLARIPKVICLPLYTFVLVKDVTVEQLTELFPPYMETHRHRSKQGASYGDGCFKDIEVWKNSRERFATVVVDIIKKTGSVPEVVLRAPKAKAKPKRIVKV